VAEEPKKEWQIPWAKETRVDYVGDSYVSLERGSVSVDLFDYGGFSISNDSKEDIKNYMQLDEGLTRNFQKFVTRYQESHTWSYEEMMLAWLRGENPSELRRERTLDWSPGEEQRYFFKLEELGTQNTQNFGERWTGDVFEFAHFKTPEGKEGAIIFWEGRSGLYEEPEVWLGDFDSFIDSEWQHGSQDWDEFRNYNDYFENGLLWAFDLMGAFENPEQLSDAAIYAIKDDPDILWEDIVRKLIGALPQSELSPSTGRILAQAVRIWVTRRMREAEKQTGQRYFWPRAMKEPKK
jgi:hypothetical protein